MNRMSQDIVATTSFDALDCTFHDRAILAIFPLRCGMPNPSLREGALPDPLGEPPYLSTYSYLRVGLLLSRGIYEESSSDRARLKSGAANSVQVVLSKRTHLRLIDSPRVSRSQPRTRRALSTFEGTGRSRGAMKGSGRAFSVPRAELLIIAPGSHLPFTFLFFFSFLRPPTFFSQDLLQFAPLPERGGR